MNIRALTPDDIKKVRELHNQYYSQFDFPDFLRLLNGYIIEDGNEVVMAGGVEMVGEAVLITNKAVSRIKIGRALVEAQQVSLFTCKKFGVRDLYAFVDDDAYARHLIQHGFTDMQLLRPLNMKVT